MKNLTNLFPVSDSFATNDGSEERNVKARSYFCLSYKNSMNILQILFCFAI